MSGMQGAVLAGRLMKKFAGWYRMKINV